MTESFPHTSLQLAGRLVESLTYKTGSYDRSSNTSTIAEGLAETVLKFLAAFESLSLPDTESGTVDSIRFYLRSDGARFPHGASVQFDELYQKLVILHGDWTFRNQILLLLLSLSRLRTKQSIQKRRTQPLNIVTQSLEAPKTRVHTQKGTRASHHTNGTANSTKQPSETRERNELCHQGTAASTVDRMVIPEGSRYGLAAEFILVHDVLYICQGIDGKVIRFNIQPRGSELVVIDPSLMISEPKRRLVMVLCELGFLFKKVQAFSSSTVQQSMTANLSVSETGAGMDIDGVAVGVHLKTCFTSQAFSYAVSKELSEYYRVMAVLESRASAQIKRDSQGGKADDGVLTLKRLYVWLMEAIRKMRILAVLIDSVSHLKGGALAGALFVHSKTGDPLGQKFIMKLLRRVSVPVFNMIKSWVFEGEFADPHQEFFIVDNIDGTEVSKNDDFDWWRMEYTINQDMLPSFVSRGLAQRILRAGKSINFLRSRCGDVEWIQEQAAMTEATEIVSYTNLEALETLVESASSKVDARLIQIMTQKFSLPLHFKALRRYVLLGQGDFVQSLLDCLKPELQKEASKMSDVVVMGSIRAAIHSSNAAYDEEDVLDRLRMKAMDKRISDSGWDVFVLDYRIDASSPLSAVISPKAMVDYQKVFRLLWKLKRTESTLNECWNGLKRVSRGVNGPDLGVGKRLKELIILSFVVRSKLSHFCINFQYYIMFEVLEAAWKGFTAMADAATDLDALIEAHEKYLHTILSKCLLDAKTNAQNLRDLLREYFKQIESFARLVGRLICDAEQILHFLHARLKGREAEHTWMESGRAHTDDVPGEYHEEMRNQLATVLECYENFVGRFTEVVGEEEHIDLRFLMFRLEFEDNGGRHEVDAEAMISEETILGSVVSVKEQYMLRVVYPSPPWTAPRSSVPPRSTRRCSQRLAVSSSEEAESTLRWEQLAHESMESVLETWKQQFGSEIRVEAIKSSEIPSVSKAISEVFFEPAPIQLFNPFFSAQFEADIISTLVAEYRYKPRSKFVMLAVWDALHQEVLAAVQISRQRSKKVLKHFPDDIKSYAYISSMAVLPPFRRKGIGRALLSAAEFVAWVWGEGEVILHVYKDNSMALELYLNNGYEQILVPPPPRWPLFEGPEILLLRRKW